MRDSRAIQTLTTSNLYTAEIEKQGFFKPSGYPFPIGIRVNRYPVNGSRSSKSLYIQIVPLALLASETIPYRYARPIKWLDDIQIKVLVLKLVISFAGSLDIPQEFRVTMLGELVPKSYCEIQISGKARKRPPS